MNLQPVDFDLLFGTGLWAVVTGSFIILFLIVAFATSFPLYGAAGPGRVIAGTLRGFKEFLSPSPRRIYAIAILTFKESIRKKALLVFVVFAVLFMFASWFMASPSDRPDMQVKNFVAFVFIAMNWLVLPVVLLLSCWGLPEDIRIRSLHTVVTKPVRRNEVVLGRMLGFAGVGTMILVIMSAVGYIWIQRQVSDNVELFCRVPVYAVAGPEGVAFLDRNGNPGKGVNVGDVNETRSFIEGGTRAAGIWTFPLNEEADTLKLESRFEAFRTYKGDMNRSIRVRYVLVNEEKSLRVPLPTFEVDEFGANEMDVARKQVWTDEQTLEKKEVDLYKDLAVPSEAGTYGSLVVHVQCLDRSQYLGVSRGDFFVRLPDRSFTTGYCKAVIGVWLKVLIIAMFSVTASTFVKFPVATLLSASVIIVGVVARDFLDKILSGKQAGGGAAESVYRLLTHMNDTVALPANPLTTSIQLFDHALQHLLWMVKFIIPDLRSFGMSDWVARGFDVPWGGVMLPSLAITVGYFLPCVLLGYFSLSLRELEAK
ncbi:MAG: hypothetical protein O2945_10770 [Planctomycetota bacterium]|nr:hypothetical protein [Planctomycetota bacterium]MDA0919540.1 hypothetical protein [Planctomycetota bacterium]